MAAEIKENDIDMGPDLTIDALMSRIRKRARPACGTPAHGSARDLQQTVELQDAFNQSVVSALGHVLQHLRQERTLRPNRPVLSSDVQALEQRLNEITGQIGEIQQRLSDTTQTMNGNEQDNRALIQALSVRLQEVSAQVSTLDERLSRASEKQPGERLDQRVEQIERRLEEGHSARQLIDGLGQRVESVQAALQSFEVSVDMRRDQSREELAKLSLRLLCVERGLRRTIASRAVSDGDCSSMVEKGTSVTEVSSQSACAVGASSGSAKNGVQTIPNFDYFAFEQRFRGSFEEIKRRQYQYLDLFRQRENVFDLGCGRGEFVELLCEHGVPVIGIDASDDMIESCRLRGLPVIQDSFFEFLERQPDESVGGIFISQVVEHLSPESIARLLDLVRQKLVVNGLLVAETGNTHCRTALNWFHLDPSHVRPVPPELLGFLCEQNGFQMNFIRFSAPLSDTAPLQLDHEHRSVPDAAEVYQDYAVVARRRPY